MDITVRAGASLRQGCVSAGASLRQGCVNDTTGDATQRAVRPTAATARNRAVPGRPVRPSPPPGRRMRGESLTRPTDTVGVAATRTGRNPQIPHSGPTGIITAVLALVLG